MGDFAPIIETNDSREHVIAATLHILQALGAFNLNDNIKGLIADLSSELSLISEVSETKGGRTKEVEEQLKLAQKKVLRWESSQSMIWALGAEGVSEYLQAVHEIQKLTESLNPLLLGRQGKEKELLDQAQSVLHTSMERLEEELIYILARNKQPFELEHVSFHSCEDVPVYDGSVVSIEDNSIEESSQRNSCDSEHVGPVIDLIHPNAIPDIKSIAKIMFSSHYDNEFCNAFVNFWKDVLDEYFIYLGVETLGIDDVLRMEWSCMSSKVKKWIWAMKLFIRGFLVREKRLFEQVLGEFGSIWSNSFLEATKASMRRLLNFGNAMVVAPRRPERLFGLLDMYEVLSMLLRDIDTLFSFEEGSFVRTDFQELLMRLGNGAKMTFLEFSSEVASNSSTSPFHGGGIHHLTKYVMNYINMIFEYADTLNLLLQMENDSTPNCCPLPCQLRLLTFNLESNLEQKSSLYRDPSLKLIFMMNNVHYMVQKVKNSELEALFGDEWIRNYTGKFQRHATIYVRETWNPILILLRDGGNMGRAILKEKCKVFGNAFEEIYKSQTGWFIRDPELRKDLRVLILRELVQAYRPFAGNVSSIIGDKYIKYTAEDLENHICDLFEGSSRSLSHLWMR